MVWDILKRLTALHCTPGDEDDAVALLKEWWLENGWNVVSCGRQALIAGAAGKKGAPNVLVCAHADSPGYIIQQCLTSRKGIAITLGGPHPAGKKEKVSIKREDGSCFEGTLCGIESSKDCIVTSREKLSRGQRVCWPAKYREENGYVEAPFLDNRIGCAVIYELAKRRYECNVTLAVTGTEEFLGFGAAAVAAAVKPDMVIVLDATYVDSAQNVFFGGGPVLTVCDKSVMIGPRQVRALESLCHRWDLPLQTEIYNFSGTDAAAFGRAGHSCPVLPLLVPTEGNHTRLEKADMRDMENLHGLIVKLLDNPGAVEELRCSF